MDEVGVLLELVKAYSPTGREEEGVRAFTRVAESLGFATEVDGAGNGIARVGSGRPQILFLGHVDTVEGELPVRVEDGRVYGRGSVDAKGALAAALLAAKDHTGAGEVVVVAAVGEEVDSRGARYLIPRHSPDFLIVGEPSGWSGVTVGYKGNLDLVLSFEAARTHLSSPEPTAADLAVDFVARLRNFVAAIEDETPFSSLTAKVHGLRTTREGGKEVVEVGMNFRLPPNVRTQHVLTYLDDHGMAGRYRIVDRAEAVSVDSKNPVVRGLVTAIRRAGARPTLRKKAGTADLNLAVPVWGCPAAAYGPGDSHLDHTDAESLAVDDLCRSVDVLRRAFAALGGR
jgi:LysW-gamma-L-lysine carboxypeptidase